MNKYLSVKAWFTALVRTSVHAGTGALIAAFGTNGVEQMAPESLAQYTSGIGMNWEQTVAVFLVSSVMAAIKFINATTEEVETSPVTPPPSHEV